MRIARVLTRLNHGGPARQVLASDPILQSRGHALRLFVGQPMPGEGDLFEAARERGLDVVRIPGLRRNISPLRDILVRRTLKRALKEFDPDLVHTHASKAGALGRMALRSMPKVARVHTFHGHVLEGYFPEVVSARLVRIEQRLALETDRIVAVSHSTAEDLLRLGVTTEAKLVVSPPGIDLEPFLAIDRAMARSQSNSMRELCGVGPERILIGVIGRLAEVKRPLLALELFESMARRHPNTELCFVGDGDQRRALERAVDAMDAELAKRVHIIGSRPDMPCIIAGLDVVLATSRSEGMPVALIEAAAGALPVVATDVGGVGELVVHERTGFLGQELAELQMGLETVLATERERHAMGSRARLRIRKRHSAGALADRLEAIYAAALEERRCAS